MSYTELSTKVVKARKKHICAWCGQRINIGELAQYYAHDYWAVDDSGQ